MSDSPKNVSLILLPAVDVVDGKAVRLVQGKAGSETDYGSALEAAEVWQRDGGVCVECQGTEYLEFDHVIPFSRGGASSVNNLQLLCRRCNRSKGARI